MQAFLNKSIDYNFCPILLNKLKKENNLSDVVVNFSSLTLSFMSNDDIKIEDISNIVTKIEPEVVVTKIDEESKETKKIII